LKIYLYDVSISGMTSFVRGQAEGMDAREEDIRDLAEFYTAAMLGLVTKVAAGRHEGRCGRLCGAYRRLAGGEHKNIPEAGQDKAAGKNA
jgi:hypothetical protein